ncbi:hypothetical protein [Saccharothrix obliqua]|uniref:hypothetical protein n=1 Tax=Saccharothrix obliqua TaxID=2861747 RepID=UPI001C5FFB49|nr:hypothetical protein [Saccharothrix obliqua]MBW4716167.1 hypothetical protein [Saccharothrix obliqua]
MTVTKWRSVLAACLFVLMSALTVSGVAQATPQQRSAPVVVAQPTESVPPGPEVNAPQQEDRGIATDTRKKLWIGGIALVLFALVYWRNKKRWDKWRKARKAG